MRITIPVSGDGDAWMSHLPEINFEFDRILDADGKLVLSEVVALFARANEFCESHGYRPTFMTSSGDGFNVYSMTIEFLRQLAAVTHWIENRSGSKAHLSSDGSAQDRRLERRMDRDQVAFCRIDVYSVASGVKFLVGYGNPKGKVIGNCESGARECAIYLTRILLNMAEGVNAAGRERNAGFRVTVEGRVPDLVPEARRNEESAASATGYARRTRNGKRAFGAWARIVRQVIRAAVATATGVASSCHYHRHESEVKNMKVKLLHKVRNHAAWLIDNKLRKFETTNGRVTCLSYSHGYEWAFDWMFREWLDYYKDREKIICEIAHRSWNYHLRDYWYAKLRKDGRKDGRENQA